MINSSLALSLSNKDTHHRFFIQILRIIGGSLFLALCAQIKIPLFFTPVPIAMHTFAVMLLGGFLGKREGALAVLAYLFEISIGLPFTASGLSNPLSLFGVTGGYLIGFVFQAYCAGWLVENKDRFSMMKLFAFLCLVTTAQLALGSLWIAKFVGIESALVAGFYPFIIGDYLKCFAASRIFAKW